MNQYQSLFSIYKFNGKRLHCSPEDEGNDISKMSFQDIQKTTPQELYELLEMDSVTQFEFCGGFSFAPSEFWTTAIKLENSLYIWASDLLVELKKNKNGDWVRTQYTHELTSSWRYVFRSIGAKYFELSHYDYLHLVIDSFWLKAFGKTREQMWCSGNIGAHGDKASGYEYEWKDKGISRNRGTLLYLLTYVKEAFGETEKHLSDQWVIDNYQKYLPAILEAEFEAGLITQEEKEKKTFHAIIENIGLEFNEGNYKAVCQLRKETKDKTEFLSSVLKMLNN